MNKIHALFAPRTALAALTITLSLPAVADVITDWNKITVDATKTGGFNSNLASRIDAIEALAVYDAVNSVRQFGTPYHFTQPAPGASAEAAAAQAAHDMLVSTFPAQQPALDAALATTLAAIPDGADKTAGQAVGAAAAADILALRHNDGSAPDVTYPGPAFPSIGQWRPTPGAFLPGINQQWGKVKPFLLKHVDTFVPLPPPAVGSKAYKEALAEVRELGSTSSVRTANQTHIAQFYKQDAELTVNEAARLLSATHSLNIEENALLFALVDTAVADARIAIWQGKYRYAFWRPVTALNADRDGVVRNNYAAWAPLLVTPPHPSYASGHSATVSAGLGILRAFFGDWNPLELHTTTPNEPPRAVRTLSQIERENGLSRIYGGIHFSFDNENGQRTGHRVAAYVLFNGPHFTE